MEGPIEVPPFFLCPISLQIMRDPVTVSTGITFDRPSIEQWIFSGRKNATTCPMTNQPLSGDPVHLITPNHTLRRLIQAWCAANSVERFPTPRPPVDMSFIASLLDDAKLPPTQMVALRRLKAIVAESDMNKHVVEAAGAGAVHVLIKIIEESINHEDRVRYLDSDQYCINNAGDEALGILSSLQMSEKTLINILETNVDFIELLTKILSKQSYNSRAYAVVVLKSLVPVLDPDRLARLNGEFFEQMVEVIKDGVSGRATKNALQVLAGVSHYGRNKVKAVRAGAVAVLVEQLLVVDEYSPADKRDCELTLAVLDELCRCADGRAELVGHAAGIAAVSEKMLGVSAAASGMALSALYSVAKWTATAAVVNEMVEVGAVKKLLVLVQIMGGGEVEKKMRERVKEMLRLHSMAWRNSPCFSSSSSSSSLQSCCDVHL